MRIFLSIYKLERCHCFRNISKKKSVLLHFESWQFQKLLKFTGHVDKNSPNFTIHVYTEL